MCRRFEEGEADKETRNELRTGEDSAREMIYNQRMKVRKVRWVFVRC